MEELPLLTEMAPVPGKPRGKMTAYAFFVHTCRQELKNSRPNQNVVFGEFSKKCAAKWKELEPHNKKPFEDMAARDKIRYQNEVELLNRQHQANSQNQQQQHQVIQTTGPNGETIQQIVTIAPQQSSNHQSGSGIQHHQPAPPPTKPHKKKNPQPKDPNAPKRPHSAFLLYCSDHRPVVKEQYPGARIGDIAKKLAAGWANLDPQVKAHYEEASNKQKERYKREKEIYIKNKQQMALEAQQQHQAAQQQMQQQQSQQIVHQNHSPVQHQVIHHQVQQHQQEAQIQPQTVIIQPHGGGSPQAVQIKEWIQGQPGQLQTYRVQQPNGGTPQTITIIQQNPNGQGTILQPSGGQRQQIIRHVPAQQNVGHIQHIQRHEAPAPAQSSSGGGGGHRGGHNQQVKTIQRINQPHSLHHPAGSTISKPKKVKQIKDPNAPKRPHSAFLLYCADHRHALRQKMPGARIGDIAKKLGQGWANVDPATKMHYEGLSTLQKERYKREKEEYKASFNQPASQVSPYNSGGVAGSSGGPQNGGLNQKQQINVNNVINDQHDFIVKSENDNLPEVQARAPTEFKQEIREVRVPAGAQIIEVDGRQHIAISEAGQIRAGPQIVDQSQVEERAHSETSGSFVQQGGTHMIIKGEMQQ